MKCNKNPTRFLNHSGHRLGRTHTQYEINLFIHTTTAESPSQQLFHQIPTRRRDHATRRQDTPPKAQAKSRSKQIRWETERLQPLTKTKLSSGSRNDTRKKKQTRWPRDSHQQTSGWWRFSLKTLQSTCLSAFFLLWIENSSCFLSNHLLLLLFI